MDTINVILYRYTFHAIGFRLVVVLSLSGNSRMPCCRCTSCNASLSCSSWFSCSSVMYLPSYTRCCCMPVPYMIYLSPSPGILLLESISTCNQTYQAMPFSSDALHPALSAWVRVRVTGLPMSQPCMPVSSQCSMPVAPQCCMFRV